MPEYIVQDTHIKHGAKREKTAKIYGPGKKITLTEEEASALGASVKPFTKEDNGGKDNPQITEEMMAELVQAAREVVDAGEVTGNGKPTVEAMTVLLGRPVTAQERDMVWEKIQAEDNG